MANSRLPTGNKKATCNSEQGMGLYSTPASSRSLLTRGLLGLELPAEHTRHNVSLRRALMVPVRMQEFRMRQKHQPEGVLLQQQLGTAVIGKDKGDYSMGRAQQVSTGSVSAEPSM